MATDADPSPPDKSFQNSRPIPVCMDLATPGRPFPRLQHERKRATSRARNVNAPLQPHQQATHQRPPPFSPPSTAELQFGEPIMFKHRAATIHPVPPRTAPQTHPGPTGTTALRTVSATIGVEMPTSIINSRGLAHLFFGSTGEELGLSRVYVLGERVSYQRNGHVGGCMANTYEKLIYQWEHRDNVAWKVLS